MRWLLLFIPLSILLAAFRMSPEWVFVTSGFAIVPLAGLIGRATEEVAICRGAAFGGILNATFGNATEMIIGLIAAYRGEVDVVRASLIGSIIGNVLLVLGLSILVGGMKYRIQTFNADAAQAYATMMAMAVISLLVPGLFIHSAPELMHHRPGPAVIHLSLSVSVVLILLYAGSLVFSLRTHESLFRGELEVAEKPEWKQSFAVGVLISATILVAIESDLLVGGIEPVVRSWGVTKLFMGIIIVPIIGNAAEHSTAVMMSLRNKMDISLNISLSSSTQIAMFVTPFIIIASTIMGRPVTVLFSSYELIALTAAVIIAVVICLDGKSHWLEGAQLLTAYLIIALSFYFAGL